ncbi:MAG: 2,3-bisphosphoglycerate-independent phosphoglycerate mutase, partial [Mycoplasma sp.]
MNKAKMKKVILIILDGFGYGLNDDTNAIHLANPKTFNNLITQYPNIKIDASEEAVALPNGQPGNSEVGHLTIGAGRVFYTGIGIINNSIKTKEFFENKELIKAIDNAKAKQSNVHILGLASDGDVHASLNHIFATIELCNAHNIIP